MRKLYLLLLLCCLSVLVNAQSYIMPASGTSTVTACTGGVAYDPGGTGNYTNNLNSTMVLRPPIASSKVSITLNGTFNIESCCDQLLIYNGTGTGGTLLAALSGSTLPTPVTYTSTSADGALTFVFTSDGSVTYAGFQANVTLTPAPTTPITAQPAASNTVCQNAASPTLSVTASGTNTFQWYSNAVNSNSGGTLISGAINATYSPSTATAGTTYYYVNVINGCGTAFPSTTSALIVNPTPTITGGTSPICANTTATLTPNISPGAWSSSNTAVATVAPSGSNGIVTGTATGTSALNANIIYTVTATGCTATKIVTVNPIPLVSSGSPTICATYGTTNLTPNITGGTWLSGTPAIASVSSGGVVTAVGSGSGPATISYTSPAACIGTIIVTLNPLPSAISGSSSVCVNATTTLSSTPTGGTWTSQFPSNAAANPTTGVITGVAAGTSTISYTGPNTCYITNVLTINAAPNIANFTSPTAPPNCLGTGNTITVNSTSMGAGSFTVFYTLTGVNSASSSTTLTMGTTSGTFNVPSASLSSAGSTTVSVTGLSNALGCIVTVGSNNTVPFTVVANPDVSNFTSPAATSACVGGGSTVTVNSTSLGAGTYTVAYNLSGANSSINNTATLTMGASNGTFNIPSASLPLSGTTTLTITQITSGGGCFTNVSSSNTASFLVNPLPNVSNLSFAISDVCLGQAATATLNSTSLLAGGYTVTYGLSGASTSSGNTSSLTMASNTGSYSIPSSVLTASGTVFYTLNSITSSAGCTTNLFSGNTAIFNVKATSALFNITGGGSYCTGSSGAPIGLSGSTSGNSYQLYQGSTPVGAPVAGAGSAISFGTFSTIATYSVLATNTTTTCTRNMSGTTNVVAPFSPAIYTVSGGGSFCAGGAGVNVNLGGSDIGVTYQLYNGSGPVGSVITSPGGPLSFGLQTTAGSYSVVASPGTSCATNMSGTATVNVNPLPTAYSATGGGSYCSGGSGVPVGLAFGALGIQYTLYNGSTPVGAVNGANAALTFGNQVAAGTYTVYAANISTGCSNNMSGSASVSINALPSVYTVTGGGGYCAGGSGVPVSINNSTIGATYQLYNGSTPVGSSTAGTGSGFSFGNQTSAGTYSVLVTGGNGCAAAMAGSASVVINASPSAVSVTGGGSYCSGGAGLTVGLAGSASGVNYQLYNGSTPLAVLAGTGTAVSYGTFTASGTYSVLATNTATGCTAGMSGTAAININATPAGFNVTGGGSLCAGSSGLLVGLSGSATGVNYQLYNGNTPVGSAIGGSGSSISFGTQTAGGTYTVAATNPSTGCSAGMTSSATITLNSLPTAFTVTGGGTYCAGGTGVGIGLNGSNSGVSYQLYNGATAVGAPVSGTGSPISFGVQTLTGSYTVFAVNTTTTCTNIMTGTASISTNPLPVAFAVTGGGSYCTGGAGVAVGLSSSTSGVNYSLYNGASLVSVVGGTGSAISFGSITAAGTYTVQASNGTTGCNANMTSSATVTINTPPAAFAVTGGGSYCAGGSGMAIGLGNSATGINYQLYNGSTPVGASVAGTNAAISFGSQTAAGAYTVLATNATTGCTTAMTGSAAISINAVPAAFAVSGGGSFCAGGTGTAVGLNSSVPGVNYQLYNGASTVGSPVAGTGGALNFGTLTAAGTYTVLATSVANSCTSAMSGNAVVSINAAPTAYTVSGGGTICAGAAGTTVTLSSSQTGINYELFAGSSATGTTIAGTGSALSFAGLTTAGTYTVLATNAGTGCTAGMTSSATISVNAAPAVYAVTGGGSYCSGGTGVGVALSNSNTGITYNLYNGSTLVTSMAGTGGSLSFPAQTAAGTYSVQAVNTTTSCTSNMSSAATISVNALPPAFTVTGSGSYCTGGSGVNLGLSGSTVGINYQLYNSSGASGAILSGTGVLLDFGARTAAGTYSVVAVNPATGCTNLMTSTATITVNSLPTVFNVTGGGSYCAGGTGVVCMLPGSASGVTYQLYNGSYTVGAPVGGTGGSISFGAQTAAGTYSVRATVTATGCQSAMTGTASVVVNPLPTAFTITGGGAYCAGGTGVNIGLNGSTANIGYQLYANSIPTGVSLIGTGSVIGFGPQTTPGVYNVVATDMTTGCVNNIMGAANVSVNDAPTAYAVIGGGSFCAGTGGANVSLASSDAGVNYQLYRGNIAVSTMMSGTGSSLDFGSQTTAGNYSVVATNATTGCVSNMGSSVAVSINPLPSSFAVTGGGSYCVGGSGVTVGLANSASGISYQLYNGSTAIGAPVAGSGGAISFGPQTATSTYTVLATNATTGCIRGMAGNATVSTNALPAAFAVTGGGGYCEGGSGVNVGLAASSTGVTYQLYNGAATVGGAVIGTGGVISFGPQTAAGTYTVLATTAASGCSNSMSTGVIVSVNPLPAIQPITGGGTYCSGGSGLVVGLAGSENGVSYQLYNGGGATGGPVSATGAPVTFGPQTASGTYTVIATNTTTGCMRTLSGVATITLNPAPSAYAVVGGGAYCTGGTGANVSIAGSQVGVNYQLYNGSTLVATVAGTGSGFNFGNQTSAGTYSVFATNSATGCQAAMPGASTVSIAPLPTAFTVLSTGSTYCAGGTGVNVVLSGSQTGVNYQLFNGSVPTGSPVAGSGGSLDFGPQTAAGTYVVVGTSIGACTSNMSGSASISISALPGLYTITGNGGYCAGTLGAEIGLNGSQSGISYRLFRGTTAVGTPVIGNGSAISFGPQSTIGTYAIVASNSGGCKNTMSGSVTVSVNPLPAVQTVTGGGTYCAGSTGMPVGITNSASGVSYQLYNGSSLVGAPVAGTGSALSFGPQTAAGVYTVMAINSSSLCTRNMTGTATVSVNAAPATFAVTGGGSFCVGSSAGVNVGLANSASGVSYQLYNGSIPAGGSMAGTGAALDFGTQNATGTYTVRATDAATMCTSTMSGNAVVAANTVPAVHALTGGGTYCSGGSGVHVGLDGSNTGVSYTLYNGATAVGTALSGTGSTLDFGNMTASGSYTVRANNISTGCVRDMDGSASVVMVTSFTPTVSINTAVGDTMCLGVLTTFNAATTGSGPGATYQWQVNGVNVGLGGSSYTYLPSNGDVVAVQFTSAQACAIPSTAIASMPVAVLISQLPIAQLSVMPNDTVCLGTSVTLNATAVYGGAAPVFTWKNEAGATLATGTSSYTFVPSGNDALYVEMTSNYRCRLADVVESAHKAVVVDSPVAPIVTIAVTPGNSIAAGQSARFTASASHVGTAAQYQWYVNGNPVPGATTTEYTTTLLGNNDTVTCLVTKYSACAPTTGQASVVMKVAGVGVANVSLGNSDIMLMPNPNAGDFIVKGTMGTNDDQDLIAEVTDMLGQVVYRAPVAAHHGAVESQVRLDGALANGMYILTLHSATERKIFHFMVGK